jgi:hypothetical protein
MLEQVPAATQHVDQGSLWTVAITTGGSVLAAILAWLTAGARARLNAEASFRASFELLTRELHKENLRLVTISERQEKKIDQLTAEVASLKELNMAQTIHIERLERSLTDAGLSVVPRSNRA